MKEQKCRPLRRWLLGTVTNKFRDVVGRVTPCAPFGKLSADRGAHGVTRPTRALVAVLVVVYGGKLIRSDVFFNQPFEDADEFFAPPGSNLGPDFDHPAVGLNLSTAYIFLKLVTL